MADRRSDDAGPRQNSGQEQQPVLQRVWLLPLQPWVGLRDILGISQDLTIVRMSGLVPLTG